MQKENETIQQILINNKYDPSIVKNIGKEKPHNEKQNTEEIVKTKWAKFTYVGKETRFITKNFKRSNIKIAFNTDNTIGKLLTEKSKTRNKYEKSGIYQLTCPTCNKKYTGQTGRPCKTRFQEHIRDFKYGNRKSKFAQHLLDERHPIDAMENIMDIMYVTNKGTMMNTIEKFYIYRETGLDNQLNDKLTVQPNAIFKTLMQLETHRGPHRNSTNSDT
jgi:hypothetical protein